MIVDMKETNAPPAAQTISTIDIGIQMRTGETDMEVDIEEVETGLVTE